MRKILSKGINNLNLRKGQLLMKMKKKEMKKKIIRMKYLVTNPKFKREFNVSVFN